MIYPFDITITYEHKNFRIRGTARPFTPADVDVRPEDSVPADGGIENVLEVHWVDSLGDRVSIPDFLQKMLEEFVIEDQKMDSEIIDALKEAEDIAADDD